MKSDTGGLLPVTLDLLCLLPLLSAPVPKGKLIPNSKHIPLSPPRCTDMTRLSQPFCAAWRVSGTHHMPPWHEGCGYCSAPADWLTDWLTARLKREEFFFLLLFFFLQNPPPSPSLLFSSNNLNQNTFFTVKNRRECQAAQLRKLEIGAQKKETLDHESASLSCTEKPALLPLRMYCSSNYIYSST